MTHFKLCLFSPRQSAHMPMSQVAAVSNLCALVSEKGNAASRQYQPAGRGNKLSRRLAATAVSNRWGIRRFDAGCRTASFPVSFAYMIAGVDGWMAHAAHTTRPNPAHTRPHHLRGGLAALCQLVFRPRSVTCHILTRSQPCWAVFICSVPVQVHKIVISVVQGGSYLK